MDGQVMGKFYARKAMDIRTTYIVDKVAELVEDIESLKGLEGWPDESNVMLEQALENLACAVDAYLESERMRCKSR